MVKANGIARFGITDFAQDEVIEINQAVRKDSALVNNGPYDGT
jgi:glycine cleavage system H lipoate-binding protein